jgi:D-alanine-D-alanine ligase
MKIGLTYDLRQDYLDAGLGTEETAEFDQEETIEALETALGELGHRTERIGHVKELVARLAGGQSWDLVFNLAEGVHGVGREAQVPALLDAYAIPYVFSDPLVLALTLHKGMAKHVVRDLGLPTPDFVCIERASELSRMNLPLPLFVKPVAEGTGKGIGPESLVERPEDLARVVGELLVRYPGGVLIERYLPGREFTSGIIGSGPEARVVGTMEVGFTATNGHQLYGYDTKSHYQDRVTYHLVDGELARACEQIALRVWRGLGCRDAGRLDLRMDAQGELSFLEVNPLAGLNPVHSDLPILCRLAGIEYRELIRWIVASALERYPGLGG